MLTAIVLHLQPVSAARLPVSHGAFANAAALDLFLRLDPALSKDLHDPSPDKPFTVSLLRGTPVRDAHDLVLSPDQVYFWRLTGLTPRVSENLLSITSAVGGVRIGDAVFHLVGVSVTSEDHPEAGRDDYAALWERWGNVTLDTITLNFSSPTTFRVGRFEQPFPLPRWVFGSLADRWNAFAPYPIGDIRDLVESICVLSNWKGETRRVDVKTRRTVGFVGRFTYRVVEPLPELRRLLGLLAEFARFAGVGAQTAHGLGQTRPEFSPPASPGR